MQEEKPKYTEADIQSLDAREHIKLRPNLYFKEIYEEKSLDRFALEVACHAIDKVLSKKCSYIKITLYTDHFSLEYDAGMSLEIEHDMTRAEGIMTKMYTCRNYKEHLAVGDEFCKLGIMTINTASEWCTLLTYSDGKKGEFLFEEGKTKTRAISESDEHKKYTKLTLKPDATLFPDLKINPTTLQEKIAIVRKKLNGFDIQLYINTN